MNRRLFLKVAAVLSAMFPVSKGFAATSNSFLASVYHLLLNRSIQEKYFSDHFNLSLASIYWGDIHNHTNMSSDATEALCGSPPHSLEEAFIYARDTAKLDFVAVTDHADLRSGFDITGAIDNWKKYQNVLAEYNDEARFVIFPGWEYTNTLGLEPTGGSNTGYGHKQVIFKETTGLPEKMIGAFNTPPSINEIEVADTAQELWDMLGAYLPSPGAAPTALTVVHTPAMSGDGEPKHNHQTDFDAMHSIFVRNIEIYSKWGNSEGLAPEGTGCAGSDTVIDYDAGYQVASKTVRSLLYTKWVQDHNPNFALGFTGGTDNHYGQPANPSLNQCGFPYRGGITGIAVSAFSRAGLWQSLYDRHTIAATTDCRLRLLFAVETNGQHLLMGSVGAHNGTVRVWALADSTVDQLEIIVDGCLQETVAGYTVDKTYTLTADYHYVYVKAVKAPSGPTTQVAWASPVYLSA
jgi:hypothetical protein